MSQTILFSPTPSWLDPEKEIKLPDQPKEYEKLDNKTKAIVFILLSIKSLVSCCPTLSTNQAISIVANSVVETGWGKTWKGWNFGGWKITKPEVDKIKLLTGIYPNWWKAEGHTASGDPPVCYYKAFNGPDQFYMEWLNRFVPRDAPENHRYHKTGKIFWQGSQDWFKELCLAGYKGVVTANSPEKSVSDWISINKSIKIRLAQYFLNQTYDGVWGKKSEDACKLFQETIGRAKTGQLDDMTFSKLLGKWILEGMKIPFIKV